MRKPQDPRSLSKKPEKVFQKEGGISLVKGTEDLGTKVSLDTAINAWNKALKDHENQGHRITEGPFIESGGYYSSSTITLTYMYEWDNLNYSVEKTEWDTMLAIYEHDLAAWKDFEEERKKELTLVSAKSIDDQIARAEHRLANLKAVKAKEPIPFPKG